MVKTQRARQERHAPALPVSDKADPYFSRAVGKALQALDRLSETTEALTLADLTAKLELTKASTFRILYTLETLGYISKTPDSRYLLAGPRQPQAPARLVNYMIQIGAAPLERLGMEYRETVSMAAIFDNRIEVVAIVESPQLIRMGNTVGRILPPHASSLGKAITSFQSTDTRDRLLKTYGTLPLTAHTIADEIALRQEFAKIQKLGHAEDWQESTLGGCCFAAPVMRPNGTAAGAVSLSMPQMRFKGPEQKKEIIAAVRNTAKTIQDQLFEG